MRNYTITEAASVLGVSAMSISNWAKNGEVVPEKTETGQVYFTEEQLINLVIKHQFCKSTPQAMRVLFVVNDSTEEGLKQGIEACKTVQEKVLPNAIFIENLQTFLQRTLDKAEVNATDDEYRKSIYLSALREASSKLLKYVNSKIDTLYSINRKYKDFTRNELEAVVLGNKAIATTELCERFDAVLEEARENLSVENLTMSGEYKKCRELPANYFEVTIMTTMQDILRKCGLLGVKFTPEELQMLLGFDANPHCIEGAKLYDKVLKSNVRIDYNAPVVKKIAEGLQQKMKKSLLQTQIDRVKKQGCYYIFGMYDGDAEATAELFNILELDLFTEVFVFEKAADKLPELIKIKLMSGSKASKFRYTQV